MRGDFSLIKCWRYRFLLVLLLATILLQPLLHGQATGEAILVLAYGAILTGGVYASRMSPPAMAAAPSWARA